jgi:hypothetical protein
MKRITSIALGAFMALILAGAAAGASATLFGGATVEKGHVKLVADVSDASTANDFSGIDFKNTGVTTFSSLTRLSTRFNVTDDDCAAGSPRFQLNFGTNNVFVYLGPSPTFTGCQKNSWVDSGNLIGNNDPCRWDTSQIAPGTQCNTYTGALALLGGMQVTGIQLVVDASWNSPPTSQRPEFADKDQTILVCSVRINNHMFFPCKGAAKDKGKGKGRDKVTICHHAGGPNGTKHVTITISRSAWPAHQAHGDTMGACNTTQSQQAHAKPAHAKKFHKKPKGGKGKRR